MPPGPVYSSDDLAYLRSDYRTLDQLCAGRTESPDEVKLVVLAGRLPAPTYMRFPGGTELFAPDLFAMMDSAGRENLPTHFHDRHQRGPRSRW